MLHSTIYRHLWPGEIKGGRNLLSCNRHAQLGQRGLATLDVNNSRRPQPLDFSKYASVEGVGGIGQVQKG